MRFIRRSRRRGRAASARYTARCIIWAASRASTTAVRGWSRDPLQFLSKGVVTLLGDAAHPVLPHTGQGAAQAIVDGVALGHAQGENANVEDALRSYERNRLKRRRPCWDKDAGRRGSWER